MLMGVSKVPSPLPEPVGPPHRPPCPSCPAIRPSASSAQYSHPLPARLRQVVDPVVFDCRSPRPLLFAVNLARYAYTGHADFSLAVALLARADGDWVIARARVLLLWWWRIHLENAELVVARETRFACVPYLVYALDARAKEQRIEVENLSVEGTNKVTTALSSEALST